MYKQLIKRRNNNICDFNIMYDDKQGVKVSVENTVRKQECIIVQVGKKTNYEICHCNSNINDGK